MPHKKQKASSASSCTRSGVSLGFTLVELIVVVTILAILATIGFVSYSSYLTGVRDTNRLSQLVSISDGLELYRTKKDLPLPDDNVEVQVNGTIIAYQGYAGSNTLETIDFTKGGKDPKDDSYFTYYLTEDRKYFQLLGFLEEEENLSSLVSSSYAADYSNRLPTVYGKKLGVLTNAQNTPIQDIPAIQTSGNLDITSGTTGYIGYMTDTVTLSGSSLQTINPVASCKRIKQMRGGSQSGIYTINPTGGDEMEVYCDMDSANGGWTVVALSADTTTQNMFETGVSSTVVSPKTDITSKGNISEIWLSGDKKDLMIQCITNDSLFLDYEIPFVIYDFNFSDIGNLIKTTKANTQFTSAPLDGEYNGKAFTTVLNYTGGGGESMYIYGTLEGSTGRLVQFAASDSMYRSTVGAVGAPGRNDSGTNRRYFNTENYCITAIR